MPRFEEAGPSPGPPSEAPRRYLLREVLEQESGYLRDRRLLADAAIPDGDRGRPEMRLAADRRPVGLALSGGGIRSATFNLGVLQALASHRILPHVDYLSTVSGGGYIGSCFSSLLSRRQPPPPSKDREPRPLPDHGDYRIGREPERAPAFGTHPANFPFNTEPGQKADANGLDGRKQVRHLRTHGDFIIARQQVLSRDMLRAVGNVLGGLFYHLLIFVVFMLVASGVYFSLVSLMVGDLRLSLGTGPIPFGVYVRSLIADGGLSRLGLHPIVMAFAAGVLMTLVSVPLTRAIQRSLSDRLFMAEGLSIDDRREALAIWFQVFFTFLTASIVTGFFVRSAGLRGGLPPVLLMLPLGVYLGGQAAALILHAMVSILRRFTRNDRSRFAAIKGLLNYLSAASFLVVLLPWFVYRLADPVGGIGLGGTWILSAVGSALLMRGAGPGGAAAAAGGILKRLLGASVTIRNATLAALVVVLLVGGVVLVSSLLVQISDPPRLTVLAAALWLTVLASILFVALGFLLDFNTLSLHYFYRDRLVEAYLQTFAPIDESADVRPELRLRDDAEMLLTHLHGHPDSDGPDAPTRCVTPAPLHLIVASLNLTASRDMTRRDRKSDQFVFSKLHCGSQTTGFMRTAEYRGGETKLARAMTISGAAASPAMGRGTFFAEAFALTLFNARLGQWLENPRFKGGCRARWSERFVFWPRYLLLEMMGSTDANARLVHLSDGGHTGDNIGIVPLLKRRCALIIACDAEADPGYAFGSLTEALRQIYIDENIKVDLELDGVAPDPSTGRSPSHRAVGRIRYPAVTDAAGRRLGEEIGWLVVLKSSITGDELARIANYRRDNPIFPQQTTADQFFDDNQFESYRELGYHVAKTSLGALPPAAWHPESAASFDACWAAQQQGPAPRGGEAGPL